MARKTNAAGVDLIKKAEGLKLTAYKCPAGVWTIGYGHTLDVKEGQTITAHQAEVMLASDLELVYEPGVEELTRGLALSDNAFSALVSFAFNLGLGRLANSTLLKRLRMRDTQGAADQFLKWTLGNGQIMPGLVKRRAAERELFLKP